MRERLARIDNWTWLIGAAFALRYGLALVLALTQVVEHNGWFWSGNKDQVQYYATAHALVHGGIAHVYTFMGYGVILTPFVVGTEFVLQAIPAVVVVQLVLAIPAAFLLFRAGERLLDRRSAAVATALWLTLPLWLSPIWFRSYSPPFNMAPWWLGLQISVDYATELLAVATIALAAGARDDAGVARGAAIGVVSGLTLLAKPSNAVLVASAVLALAVWRRRRAAVAALAAAGIVGASQAVLDWRLSGRPLHIQYWSAWPYGNSKPLSSLAYVPRTFGKLFLLNYTGPLLMCAFIVALALTWRRFPAARWLVVAQVVAYSLFFSVLYYSISEFMLRFMTTAFPALCLACGAAIAGRRDGREPAAARPLGRGSSAVVAASLLGAVALAVFTGVAPKQPVVPVVASLRPAAAWRDGRVVLAWHAPPAPARLAYRVNRARTPGGRETSIWTGLATAVRDRPPPGRWWYSVHIEPGSHPSGLPPATRDYGVSRPAGVTVRPR